MAADPTVQNYLTCAEGRRPVFLRPCTGSTPDGSALLHFFPLRLRLRFGAACASAFNSVLIRGLAPRIPKIGCRTNAKCK